MYNKVSSDEVKCLFSPQFTKGNVEKSSYEQDIVFNLKNLVDEISCGAVKSFKSFSLSDVENGVTKDADKKERTITLEDLLMFMTGSCVISRNQTKIKIIFSHVANCRVVAKICTDEICFPVNERYIDDNFFTKNMIEDIINSPGFGVV